MTQKSLVIKLNQGKTLAYHYLFNNLISACPLIPGIRIFKLDGIEQALIEGKS